MSRENCLINSSFAFLKAIPAEIRLCWRPQPQTDWPGDFSHRCPNFAGARKASQKSLARAESKCRKEGARSMPIGKLDSHFSGFFFLLKKIWKTKKEWTYYTTKSPLLNWKKIRLKVLGKSLVGAPCSRRVREAGGPSSSPLLVSLHYHIRGRCSAETMLHACRNKGPERGKKELDLRGMGKSLSRRLQRA